jgi:hypothetical protein
VPARIRNAWLTVAGVLLLAGPLLGQIQIGDNLNLNLNGTLSANYSGTYGNEILSTHGFGFGGAAAMSGSYYNPNFLSFNINPYFNQSRSNSNFGSVTNASGVTLSTAIFSGSHFPGSVNYAKAYNDTGNYGIPGISSFDTNSNSQSFAISWSALLPKFPTLNVGYQKGDNNYSLYGTNERGKNNFHSLFLNSNYTIAGFGMGGGVSMGASNALIPQVIVGGKEAQSNSNSTNYSFSVSHRLPWSGSFSSTFNRSNIDSDYLGYKFNGTINRWAANAGVHPTEKLSFSLSTDYTDNLSGSLYQATVPGAQGGGAGSGTPAPIGAVTAQSQQSSGWNFLLNSTYAFARNLQAQGTVERRLQFFQGKNYGSTMYSGGVYYTRQIMGGYFGSSLNIIDSRLDNSNQNSLGFTSNTNYNRRIGAWQVGGYFNYSQNVQTLLVSYTTSFYNFSGNVGRGFGRLHWNAGASVGRSGLTAQPGTSSRSESFSSSIGTGRLNLTGNYSKSDGNSLASGGGLVQPPIPPIIPPNLLVMYGGESYAFALSGSPIRKLSATASYVKARNNLTNQGVASWNDYEQENFFFQYRFRQVGLTGGYTRLVQGFSASGTPPANVNSFSVGIYRWFDFF